MATFVKYSPLLIVAVIWELVVQVGIIQETTLPTLTSVLVTLFRMLQDDILVHTAHSLWRGTAGFLMAVVFGTAAGIVMAWYRVIRLVFNPILQCTYPLPKSALLPLLIIWLGLGDSTKVTLIFIGCMLPVIISSYNAARGVQQSLVWSARSFGASNNQVLWEIVLPAALPEILTGIRTALAIGFILLVASELIIANNGIGFLIGNLGGLGDYQGMFAGVIIISLIGYLADRGYMMLSRRLLAWQETQHG